jgi:hypothetical protein
MVKGEARKKCPRCSGYLYFDSDHFGKYFACINCGWMKDLIITEIVAQPERRLRWGGRSLWR